MRSDSSLSRDSRYRIWLGVRTACLAVIGNSLRVGCFLFSHPRLTERPT
jgi:hypothetical protein